MEPQSAPSVQPSEPVTRSHRTLIIAIAAGVLILAGAALAYTKLANKPAVTPSPIASATPDMGAGWKTFNSQYFTLSFKVPPGFEVYEDQNYIAITNGSRKTYAEGSGANWPLDNSFWNITRYENSAQKPQIKKQLLAGGAIQSAITIDGSRFETFTLNQEEITLFDASMLHMAKNPYNGPGFNQDGIALGNQILASFRFASDVKAGWKTYTNTAHHYSMRYPANWSFANACGGEGQAVDPTISCGEAIIYSLPQVSRSALHADVVSNTGDLSAEAFAKAILKEATIIDPITTQSIAGKEAAAATFTGTLKFSVDPKDRSGSLVEEKMVIIFIKLNAHDMLRIQYPKAFCSDSGCFSDERNTILKEIADSLTIL